LPAEGRTGQLPCIEHCATGTAAPCPQSACNTAIWITVTRVPRFFCYFVQWPTSAQLIDNLSYCCYMFRNYCVILRELVVCTLLSYTSMSVQLLVIQFKVSHMFPAVEISVFCYFRWVWSWSILTSVAWFDIFC
jgi:hypothetical protein